ncbi:tail fiber domain-containing protein [Kluyvera ascorbata]|uniref:tail fiber domain-containing protein n=1 Tax=Kluyvera ascorbata TaxID=51288 RepID=UPI002DB6CB40|nr:tail fiber domain-containing protein [Kluyvera ascorbata]MEB6387812.1 tail fiber domain-containing protein [Kluyvera ascorbata]
MSAGTLTLTNNSNAVAGIDTSFTTELAAGDFIVVTTGGVTYTLPVKSIESDTALTLARNYNGPAVTAGAWTVMPRDTLNRISAQIAADTAYAIRQRVLEIDNWYQLLEVNGDVTIKMADGSSYTGPSWLKLIDVMKEMQIDQIIFIAEQIRADAQQVAEDKPVIIQAKEDAEAAATAAAASEENAAKSEDNAASSASTASTKADEAAESARQAAESNPANYLLKDNNLQDLADRAAAWLNVRPTGATPLAADAAGDEDAPRWKQVKDFIASVRNVLSSWSVINSLTAAPGVSTTTYGGEVNSTLKVGTADYGKAGLRAVVTSGASGVKTVGAQVVVTDSTGSTSTQKVINLGTVNGLTGGTITTDTSVTGNISGAVTYGDTSSAGTTVWSSEVGSFFNGWGAAAGRPGAGVYLNAYNVVGGALGASLNLVSAWGKNKTWTFSDDGNGAAPGNWVSNSDCRIKTNIAEVTDPLVKMTTIRGVTWERLDGVVPGIGFIAQDVQKCFPNSVFVGQDRTLDDGKVVEGVLSVDTGGVAAALHHESILQLMGIMKEAITTIAGVTSDESAKAALEALAERIPANNPS